MATAKQIVGAMSRAAEFANGRGEANADVRAGYFVAYLAGTLRAMDELAAVAVLHQVLGIEDRKPTHGA